MPAADARPLGMRLIVVYKFARGAIALILAGVLTWAAVRDGESLRELAGFLYENMTGAWSLRLANLLIRASSRRALHVGAAALMVDGAFTFFEGWALAKGFRWAPWLVVIATASLLPIEIYELSRGIRAMRVAVFLANVAVVIYLARQKARERAS